MRPREKFLANLEEMYREAFSRAREKEDRAEMAELDFEFQRDQLFLEALLDIRKLLADPPTRTTGGAGPDQPREESLLEKAEKLRRITRLR